jgi:hypothetical protein
MLQSMKEVFVFLNQVDRESDALEQPFNEALAKMKAAPLSKVSESKTFSVTVKPASPSQKTQVKFVRYKKPLEQINAVMASLGVSDANTAGEQTFDLYYEMNVEQ